MRATLLEVVLLVSILSANVGAFTVPKTFGCKNTMISDEWRAMVLKFHNDHRRRVALGQQLSKGGKAMPVATNMNELVWDCDLEHNAWLNLCNATIKVNGNKYSVTDQVPIGKSGKCDITEETREALNTWWAESAKKDLSGANNMYAGIIKNFGRMVFGTVKGFACTYSNCDTNTPNKLMCIYDQKVGGNAPLYTAAQPPDDATKVCTAAGCDCVDSLCQYKYTGAEYANPQPLCKQDGMTYDMQMIATDMHNYYRRILATGWGKDSNGYAPRAKQLPAFSYDCKNIGKNTLGLLDCAKLDSLPSLHTPGFSLNYHKESYKVSAEETLKKAIDAWWGQLERVDVNDGAIYTTDVSDKAKFFAPMALESVNQLGCAVKDCTKTGYMVAACQYNGIPDVDSAMYTVGAPCTGCAQKSLACEKVGGQLGSLCV